MALLMEKKGLVSSFRVRTRKKKGEKGSNRTTNALQCPGPYEKDRREDMKEGKKEVTNASSTSLHHSRPPHGERKEGGHHRHDVEKTLLISRAT